VIERALASLPSLVDAETVSLAETHLVDRATEFGPRELGRIGRRILDVVAPDVAEKAEAALLADLEAHAVQQARLTLRRLGDGTTRLSGRLPDAAATRLATYLEAYSNPRVASDVGTDVFTRLPYPRRMGRAFVELLETRLSRAAHRCTSFQVARPSVVRATSCGQVEGGVQIR
jgi:hypothetical protein